MVYGLAEENDAPRVFSRLSRNRVPVASLALSCGLLLLIGLPLLGASGSVADAFDKITTVSAICFMFVWTIILISYVVYRRRRPHLHEASTFKMPGGVVMCYATMAFFVFVLWTLWIKDDTRQALLWTPLWFVILLAAYFLVVRRRPAHEQLRAEHAAKVERENAEITRRS